MLIVAPIPPEAPAARPVLYTSIPLTPSEARFEKSNERLVPAAPLSCGLPVIVPTLAAGI